MSGLWRRALDRKGSNVTQDQVSRADELRAKLQEEIQKWADLQPDIADIELQLAFTWCRKPNNL